MEKKIPPGTSDPRWSLQSRKSGSVVGTPPADAAWNYADRRARSDRRFVYDRRELIRFENDRRAGRERRVGMDPWAIP